MPGRTPEPAVEPPAVALVTGVGDATGAAVARRFSAAGYRVAMIARTAERLRTLSAADDRCHAYPFDLSDADGIGPLVARIGAEIGPIRVLVHNAVSATFGRFLDRDPAELERNFRVNVTSLLYLARAVAPAMIEAGAGAIVATGNTAALRGVPTYALFAPTKAAQRILCEALARDLGPKRVHVGYVVIDAPIDAPWLAEAQGGRPSWLEPPAGWPFAREDYFAKPDAIAEEVFHLAHQDPSAWSFETVIRPFAERW